MQHTQQLFLEALKAALKNEQVEWNNKLEAQEWMDLFRMAEVHQILPMIYEAVYRSPAAGQADPQILAPAKAQMVRTVIMQTQKTGEFEPLYRYLRESGICPLVVKGIVCRNIYPNPDYRISGDEDLLIRPEDFRKCHDLLREYGMQTSEQDMDAEELESVYEVPYGKKGSLIYIELHKSLFPPESEAYGDLNRFFANVHEDAIDIRIDGTDIRTMGYTDHLFYLICHSFKHFLHSGFGMIITINTNGTLIDEAWADFFAENKPRRINITLYGASNETYERLCHYPGGFDKAVNGIRLLRERNIDVKVNGSLAKANVDDRMKIIELGESLDAPVRIDTYMYPSVRERNHAYNNQARLDPEMAAKARVEVLQREMGEEVFAQYRKIQLDEAENTPEGEAVPGQMACRAGKSSFVVNWQGEMRSCVVLDKPSIPLRNVEFEEAWKFTKKETESLRISARCSSCKLRKVCNTCVAAAIAETGKADGVPEYLCRYTEATVRYLKETSKK